MPGINRPGFNINELGPGVNIIHGPNAAGKTTVARALNLLLWPDSGPKKQVRLSASFSLGSEKDWVVKLDAGKREFQYRGSPSEGIELPPADHADRYNLPLHELLQEDTTNESFAETIVLEMFGGYDIPTAVGELEFNSTPGGIGNAKKAAKKAAKKVKEAKEKLRNLEKEHLYLQKLEDDKQEAEAELRHARFLEQVINWYEVKQKYDEALSEFDSFPDAMEAVTGRETEEFERLQNEIDKQEEKIKKSESVIREKEKILENLQFPYDEPVDELVAEMDARCEKIRELERDIEKYEAELEAARECRKEEEKNLAENVDVDSLEGLDRVEYRELADFARRAEKICNELDTLEKFSDILEVEKTDNSSLDLYKKGCNNLETWLASPAEKKEDIPGSYRYSFITSVLVIALLTGMAGFLIHPAFLGGLVIPVVLYLYARFASKSEQENMRPAVEQQYQELNLEIEPEKWEFSSVRTALKELYDRRATVEVEELKEKEWRRHQEQYQNLQDDWEEITSQREEYIEKYGFAPDTDDRTLFILFDRLSRWQDHNSEVKGLTKKLEKKKGNLKEEIKKTNEEFTRWGMVEAQDGSKVFAHLSELKEKNQTYRETTRELKQAQKTLVEAETELPRRQEEFEELFNNLDLQPGDEAGLRQLCERREAFQECRSQLERKESLLENEADKMEEMADFDPEYKNLAKLEIQEELEEARQKSERLDEIKDDIREIESKIKIAKEGYELEDALAERERKFDLLEGYFEENCRRKVGGVLGEYMQQVNTEQSLPVVFKYAKEILVEMTAGRYKLDFGQGKTPSFLVKDAQDEKEIKPLEELSSGTRVQVLMAVRLAFVEHGEKRTRLPVYMDETLANTDDERARIIIRSALRLAASGRQVFYFTAQGDEVAKWKAVASKQSEPIKVIDLVEERDLEMEGAVEIPDSFEFEFGVQSELPSKQLSHAEYGRELGVPPVDPFRGLDSIHLWYLIEDVELLDRLLSRQIKTWGQLENLLELGNRKLIDEERAKKLKQLARAIGEFLACRKKGLNRPVDRIVLESSGAVSEKFIDEVSKLAEKYNGDPEKIIEGLENSEVSGFRSAKTEELEGYLEEEGYIDRRSPVAPKIIRAAMISVLDEEMFKKPEKTVDRLLERITRS
jgi:hypothetical protein